MVTKLQKLGLIIGFGYILAKNHMVTKRNLCLAIALVGYILAKNHMVTKPTCVVPT